MAGVDKYVESYRLSAQRAINNELVLAAGILGVPGGARSGWISLASPLAGAVARRKAQAGTPGFPLSVLMAVTPTRILAFQYKPQGRGAKIRSVVVEWPRSNVVVQLGQITSSIPVWFHLSNGTSVELEGSKGFGPYKHLNDNLYAALGLNVPTS